MSEGPIAKLRALSLWLTLAGLAATAVRFAWVSAMTLEAQEGAADGGAAAQQAAAPKPTEQAVAEAVPAEPAAAPTHVRVMLSVSYARGPASVFVNGQPMGRAAYVGEFTCEPGEELKIRIEPDRGRPIEGVRACEAGFITVSE